MTNQTGTALRYLLWLGLVLTADANRRHFGLPTTWVFHLSGNSLALLLPELYEAATRRFRLDRRARGAGSNLLTVAHHVVQDLAVNNPNYVEYVGPPAAAYIVSHPRFNIYKGKWGRIRVMGLGLDAIPHGATAFALSNLVMDTLDTARHYEPHPRGPAAPLNWMYRHPAATALGFLALASAVYETGEYKIFREEYARTGGDRSKMNMEWSVPDTLRDLLANTVGYLAAVARRRGKDA